MPIVRIATVAVVSHVLLSPALGGTVRYELTELLGQHSYDGSFLPLVDGRIAYVETPYTYYSADEARLVIEGTVHAGKAHGDGIIREALEFDLVPSVGAVPSFANEGFFSLGQSVGPFRIEKTYSDPFVPNVTPLPNPAGDPPISFNVPLFIGLGSSTALPPLLDPPNPGELVLAFAGVVVDIPIIVTVTEAYIELEGPGILPEPSSMAILVAAAAILLNGRRCVRFRPS